MHLAGGFRYLPRVPRLQGGHQEPPAGYIKRRGRAAHKRAKLVHEPVVPTVVVVAAYAANYPVIFFEIPVAIVAANTLGEKEGK